MIVVIKAYDKYKVGSVIGVSGTGDNTIYQVQTEDGKIYDGVKVDDFGSPVYIHRSITGSFLSRVSPKIK